MNLNMNVQDIADSSSVMVLRRCHVNIFTAATVPVRICRHNNAHRFPIATFRSNKIRAMTTSSTHQGDDEECQHCATKRRISTHVLDPNVHSGLSVLRIAPELHRVALSVGDCQHRRVDE